MLDETMRRAARQNVRNLTATLAAAEQPLPYPDAVFDAAYLVGVLGEIANRDRALAELHRLLKQGGRLVVGEVAADPDFVPFGRLCRLAEDADFRVDRRFGSWFSYFARFIAD